MTQRGPGQRAGLTREQVLEAALAVLRRDGLTGVSMRRVATELGVAPNALYSHVPDKDALVGALLDAVLADVPTPTRGDWRARIRAVLRDSRRVLLAHPDLVPLALSRQTMQPHAMRLGEVVLEQLARGGVEGRRAVVALQVLLVHTIGGAAFDAPRAADPDPAGREARGRAAAAAAPLPRVAAAADELGRHHGDAVFEAGLRWILDGLVRAADDPPAQPPRA